MIRAALIAAILAGGSLLAAQAPSAGPSGSPPATSATVSQATRFQRGTNYGTLPLAFERNQGQVDARTEFLARGSGYSLFLTRTEAVLALRHAAPLRMTLVGASEPAHVTGLDALPGASHYLVCNDPATRRTDIPTYAKVHYGQVYPGVDLVYYGNQGQLEYDFIVAPGGDPARIRMSFEGTPDVRIDARGDLVIEVAGGHLLEQRPIVYQEVGGGRTAITGRYVMTGTRQVGFEVARYDASRPLIIDPVLVYATYVGGTGDDSADGIAVDGSGNAYVTGRTTSVDLPATAGAYDTAADTTPDAFVWKLDASGTTLLYATYLGGSGSDEGRGIAVDVAGRAVVTGLTTSTDFPTAGTGSDLGHNGGVDAFVTKLTVTGAGLTYSTFLGGGSTDSGEGVAVDPAGNAYVTGSTFGSGFPTSAGVVDATHNGSSDVFVTKVHTATGARVYSTYLGGSAFDQGTAIAVIGGNAYVTGFTADPSSDLSVLFPITGGAFDVSYNGGAQDGFVAKLNAAGTALLYSTYLGGSGTTSDEQGDAIAVDSAGNAYVAGWTPSADFPVTIGAFDTSFNGGSSDAFVATLNPTGSALGYSTFLGGADSDEAHGLARHSSGNVHVTGRVVSADFPTTPDAADATHNGGADAFMTTFDAGGLLLYSTYLGGSGDDDGKAIAVDSDNDAIVAGFSAGPDFPVTPGALSTLYNGGGTDAFVAKLGTLVLTLTLDPPDPPAVAFINPVGSEHCVIATVEGDESGAPVAGIVVRFTVIGVVNTSGFETTDSYGKASFCYTSLVTGTDVIKVFADANNDGVQDLTEPSGEVSNTWELAGEPTTTVVSSSIDPSTFGQSVTVTATVSPVTAGGTPTGTVQFFDNGFPLGTGVPLIGGAASVGVSSFTVGAHLLTAEYNGDGAFGASATTLALTQDVIKADTTTILSSSVEPSVFGQTVTFTAMVAPVAPGIGIVTGAVTFSDGGTPLAVAVLDATGRALLTTSSLALGSHTITAEFHGDGNFNTSSALAFTQTVTPAPSVTTVTSSVNPSALGQEVTLTARVMPAAPAARTLSFLPPTSFSAGAGATTYSVATGDFNGDGVPDLATTGPGADSVSVLLGTGAGDFGGPTLFSVGNDPVFVLAADLDADGRLDLVTANQGSASVSFLRGNGDGTFATATDFATGTTASASPSAIAVGDFNADGTLDLAIANAGNNNVSIRFGEYAPDLSFGFGTGPFNSFLVGTTPLHVATADFNDDGALDLATANADANTVTIRLGMVSGDPAQATGLFAPVDESTTFFMGTSPRTVVIGDFNLDGRPDLATPNVGAAPASGTVAVRLATGPATFGPAATYPMASSPDSSPVAPEFMVGGDFNGDGQVDLLVSDSNHSLVGILVGSGTGMFAFPMTFDSGLSSRQLAAADLDGDGMLDLAIPTATSDVHVRLNGGTGPTGTVQFRNDGVDIGTPVAVVAGWASMSISTLTAGTHPLTADYSGDVNFTGSTGALDQIVGAGPGLSLTLSVDQATVSPFGTLVYTLTYANTGTGTATGVTIGDVLPAHTTFVSASHGGTNMAGTVSWTIGPLAAGASGSVTLTLRADPTPICRTDDDNDDDEDDDSDDRDRKGHRYGDHDRDDEDHRSRRNGHRSGDGCPHDEARCTPSVVNQGTIQSVAPPTSTPSNTVTTLRVAPVLHLRMAVDDTRVVPGETLVYTLTYSNTGTGAATGVTIGDIVPAHTAFVSASHGGANMAGTVSWTLGNVAPGATAHVTLTVRVSQALTCRRGDGDDRGGRGHRHGDGDRDDRDHRSGRNGHHRGDGCSHDDEERCTVSVPNQGAIRSTETPAPKPSNTVVTRVTVRR